MDRKENAKLIKGFIGTFFFYTGHLEVQQYEVQNNLWKDLRAYGMRACELCFIPARFSCIINMEKQSEHTSDENGGMNNEADDDRNLEDGI